MFRGERQLNELQELTRATKKATVDLANDVKRADDRVEWHKLIMLAKAPDQQSERYNYSVCHQCGVVYAARRPAGRRFLFLLEHFGEVTGKAAADGIIPNPLLNPYPLSEADKEQLRQM